MQLPEFFSLYKLGGTGEKRVIFILEGGQLLSDINMDNGISVLNCQAMEKALAIGFRRDIFESHGRRVSIDKGNLKRPGHQASPTLSSVDKYGGNHTR